jgi:outer membrane protein OmpA-like peptidoglycan-associated protein
MKVHAKCHNYAGCLLAYRGDEIEIADGAPMVCPECGKPVAPVKGAGGAIGKSLPLVIAVVLIGGIAFFGVPMITKWLQKDPPGRSAETEVNSSTTGTAASTSTQTSDTTATTAPQSTEPAGNAKAVQNIDLDLGKEENKQVKKEVLERIDLMPNISEANKDKLYNSVERARSMGKVLVVPFASGRNTLGPAETQALQSELESAEIMKLRDDPTAVFVILGYADTKGDPKKNLAISQARADAVLEAMRDKAGVSNVMHSVAMGGSTILDSKDLEKNRIAEVWAVLP